jgi:hypothetical protein
MFTCAIFSTRAGLAPVPLLPYLDLTRPRLSDDEMSPEVAQCICKCFLYSLDVMQHQGLIQRRGYTRQTS